MQALKALVIFMGILIAVGVAVLGVTIYNRATKMVTSDKPAPAASSIPPLAGATPGSPLAPQGPATSGSAGPAPNFGVRDLGLPSGSIVVSVQPLESRVLVQARLPDGGTRILVLDPATGAVAGEWRAPGAAGMQAPTPLTPPPSSDRSGAQPPPSEGGGRP